MVVIAGVEAEAALPDVGPLQDHHPGPAAVTPDQGQGQDQDRDSRIFIRR